MNFRKNNTLQSQTASGVFWTFLEQLGRRGIGILVTILLARFLTPKYLFRIEPLQWCKFKMTTSFVRSS